MSILTASNLSQSFGAHDVFVGISATVPNDGKIGLVGPNGVGKTTLLRILAAQSKPTTGHVHWARGTRLGYLQQEAAQAFAGREHSVYDEMLTVFAGLLAEQDRLREMEAAMAINPTEQLVEQYGMAQERFEMAGGYDYEIRIRQVLHGLGFQSAQWKLSLLHLSGGQKTRALLARLLLEKPDLLILDEPTNHLDVEAIEWLESYLRAWEGALIVVSHDRYFLDKVVNHIWEMGATHLEAYRGNYSAYVQQREARWARHDQLFTGEKERLLKELDYIRRHIASQNTDIAKGKLKRLTRDIVAIEELGLQGAQGKSWLQMDIGRMRSFTVGEADQRIKALRGPTRPAELKMKLKATRRSGRVVLSTKGLQVGYPGHALFSADDIELERQECAGLIGSNGTGKSTFLRTIMGLHAPLKGEAKLGVNLNLGYFAQAHDNLNSNKTVLEQLLDYHMMPTYEARNYLAQYLFREDDVYRPVSALSGGERGRLALAILALNDANFLLLDEPTNHLDIPAQEVLQQALEQFTGTILLVSHDRYLVSRLATQIWEVEEGHLHVFKGTYQEYIEKRQLKKQLEKEATETKAAATKRATAQAAKSSKNEQRRRAKALAELEEHIMELEAQLEELSGQLQAASEAQDFDAIQRISESYQHTQAKLEQQWSQWEELAEE